jgi:hypothetical protein
MGIQIQKQVISASIFTGITAYFIDRIYIPRGVSGFQGASKIQFFKSAPKLKCIRGRDAESGVLHFGPPGVRSPSNEGLPRTPDSDSISQKIQKTEIIRL